MAQPAVQPVDTDAEPQVEDCSYQIDEEELNAGGMSLDFLIWQRLCWDGPCTLCKAAEGPKPVLPLKMPPRRSMWAAITKCAGKEEYILPRMSVSEVVFRILLDARNEPMLLSEIYEEIMNRWATVMSIKSVSITDLQRMLDTENEYRIGRAAN